MRNPYRRDVPDQVLEGIGKVAPAIMCEAVHHGIWQHNQSRDANPASYANYTGSTRANMRYDDMASVLRGLVLTAGEQIPELRYRITENQRSTEVLLDPFFGFKINRAKKNRAGRTTGVNTRRRRVLKTDNPIPVGQLPLQFGDGNQGMGDAGRIWLVTTFDMDELEEDVDRVFIGVEARRKFFWRCPLLPADDSILASLPLQLADAITDLREQRA